VKKKAVALLSGGLDSSLAVCLMKAQGIKIAAVNFQTIFECCKIKAEQAARSLGVPMTVVKAGDDYLDILRKPRFGYGRGINPCVDCRIYMFRIAKKHMKKIGASFIVSGEVLGQRPMSQKRRHFDVIEEKTGLKGLIVRPLSAQWLPPTKPERAGILDRSGFLDAQGRTREKILKAGREHGLRESLGASAGCALAQPEFARKVRDVFQHDPKPDPWEFKVLKMGRHFRLGQKTKVVLGKNKEENAYLERLRPAGTAFIFPKNFRGPGALLIGAATPAAVKKAVSLMLYYTHQHVPPVPEAAVEKGGTRETYVMTSAAAEPPVTKWRIT